MNDQQPNWEKLINQSAQHYNADDPVARESFRRDLAEGVSNGILNTMTYEQRMAVAKTKMRFTWEFFVICSFIWLGSKLWDKVEPYWNSIDASVRDAFQRDAGEWCFAILTAAALIYGFVKIAKFIGGLFCR